MHAETDISSAATFTTRPLKLTGLLGVALLGLTACVNTGTDGDDQDQEGTETTDEDQTEDAEETDEGDEPTEDATEEETDDETEDAEAEAPEIGEIEDAMWDAAASQQSVTVDADQPEDDISLLYSGDLEGEGSSLEYSIDGIQDEILSFGAVGYQTVDGAIADYESQVPEGEEPEIPPEDLRDALAAEGSWVEISPSASSIPLTTSDYLDTLLQSHEQSFGVASFDELDLEVEEGTHEGEDAWIYSNEDYEIIVLADEEEPLPLLIDIAVAPYASTLTFSEWGEAEGPEEPESSEIVDIDTQEDVLSELLN